MGDDRGRTEDSGRRRAQKPPLRSLHAAAVYRSLNAVRRARLLLLTYTHDRQQAKDPNQIRTKSEPNPNLLGTPYDTR